MVKRTINPSRPVETKFLVTDEGKTLDTMTEVGKERGWPEVTRVDFDAQRGQTKS